MGVGPRALLYRLRQFGGIGWGKQITFYQITPCRVGWFAGVVLGKQVATLTACRGCWFGRYCYSLG